MLYKQPLVERIYQVNNPPALPPLPRKKKRVRKLLLIGMFVYAGYWFLSTVNQSMLDLEQDQQKAEALGTDVGHLRAFCSTFGSDPELRDSFKDECK